jgi:replicative DNA helicase
VFKESGNIEYTCDIAMILTRSKQADAANSEFRSLDLNVVKNRNGECGIVKFRFMPNARSSSRLARRLWLRRWTSNRLLGESDRDDG